MIGYIISNIFLQFVGYFLLLVVLSTLVFKRRSLSTVSIISAISAIFLIITGFLRVPFLIRWSLVITFSITGYLLINYKIKNEKQ